MVTKFDSATCQTIQAELCDALLPLCEKYGITVAYGGGKYSEFEFSAKIQFKLRTTSEGMSVERAEFERFCRWFGVQPHAYMQIVKANGADIRIVGFKQGRPKYCVVGEDCLTGKRLLYSREILKSLSSETPSLQPITRF